MMLGAYEWNNNINPERAVKHWIISATQGEDNSIKELMKIFKLGQNFNTEFLSKDDLEATLRAHIQGRCKCNKESTEEGS